MYAALLPALATCGVALSLACLVLARREHTSIHWVYLGLLLAIVAWTGGVAWRHMLADDADLRPALHAIYLGMHAAPVLWFWLAAVYTRSPLVDRRWLRGVAVAQPVLGYLGWWTNDQHGLFASEVSHAALQAGPAGWGGPLFWTSFTGMVLFAVAGGGLVVAQAWRLRGRERTRSIELAVALLAPLLLSQIYVFQLLPVPYDLTPTGLCITTVIFYGLLAREGIFEAVPLARRDVIEDLRDGVFVADRDGVVLDANPAAHRLLGEGAASPVGRPLRDVLAAVVVEEAGSDVLHELARAFDEGRSGALACETRRGRRVELTLAAVRSSVGHPAGAYAVLRDRTDQHRYEQIVRQSQKLESVGVLAAGVAHEVNNPLAFIQANLGCLQGMADVVERNLDRLPPKDAEELADLRELLDDSLEGITRISRIVDRLRRFSRAPEDEVGPVDSNAAVEEAVRFARLHRQTVRNGGAEVETCLAPDLPPVRGSRDALAQVLLNLLMNATQAVEDRPDGRVRIQTYRQGDQVVISVEDNGPGVSPAIRRHIFDPFFTTKSPDEGTGLGLAIAYDMARDHGGRLELCEKPGEGARFCLTLPVAAAEAA